MTSMQWYTMPCALKTKHHPFSEDEVKELPAAPGAPVILHVYIVKAVR